MEEVVQQVQKAATVADIVHDHIHGLSGYEIAAKYGLDTERVKELIREADERGDFVPKGEVTDNLPQEAPKPLEEGVNPTAKKASTKTQP